GSWVRRLTDEQAHSLFIGDLRLHEETCEPRARRQSRSRREEDARLDALIHEQHAAIDTGARIRILQPIGSRARAEEAARPRRPIPISSTSGELVALELAALHARPPTHVQIL